MSRFVQLLTLSLCLALAACGSAGGTRPDLPDASGAVAPQVQIVERIVYVPIDSALTQQFPVAEGPLSTCPSVAAARKASLLKCNARLQEIEQIEGTKREEPRP